MELILLWWDVCDKLRLLLDTEPKYSLFHVWRISIK